ncbi:MAG: DUF4160 domain-containing protein [Bacteroidetes bacterium]|nr:DUF4160 domain-containing protein [Bacteroidota bacterium]
MSPTILKYGKYRFFFNSREETRKHVHVSTSDDTAKIWLEPAVALRDSYNLSSGELTEVIKIAEERKNEFITEWNLHFGI